MKPIKRAVLVGLVLEASLVGLFLLFPFGLYGGSPLGETIIMLHLPFLATIGWILNLFDLMLLPAARLATACISVLLMWMGWSALFYFISRFVQSFGHSRRMEDASAV